MGRTSLEPVHVDNMALVAVATTARSLLRGNAALEDYGTGAPRFHLPVGLLEDGRALHRLLNLAAQPVGRFGGNSHV